MYGMPSRSKLARLAQYLTVLGLSACLFFAGYMTSTLSTPHVVAHAQGSSTRTQVWNEVPARNASGNWILTNYPTPANAADCFYGGLHQTPGRDYVIRGSQLFSSVWSATDISNGVADLTCNYTY